MDVYFILFHVWMLGYMWHVFSVSRRYLHMLQLHSYIHSRFLHWFFQNYRSELLGFRFWWTPKKREKKPFVVTARVMRLYATIVGFLLLEVVLLEVLLQMEPKTWVILLYLGVLLVLSELKVLYVLAANAINTPLEKSISKSYVHSAKKTLKQHPGLMVLGITGSYGKTSTKYILTQILKERYHVLMTPQSYNTTMGVVKTIREQLSTSHQVFVVEMGAKKRGDIKEICDLVKPKMGILTSIGPQHLETFLSMENIVDTKFELIDALPPDGKAFLNDENTWIKNRMKTKPSVCYALSPNPDVKYWAQNIRYDAQGLEFELCTHEGECFPLRTKLLGRHNVLNIVSASAVCLEMGVLPHQIQYAVKRLLPVPHRLELKNHGGGVTVIDDAFNSNPEGAKEALHVLGQFHHAKRILVTPGLVELGEKEYECNFQLGEQATQVADFIVLVGEKRAKPILEGIRAKAYDPDKVYIAKDLEEAIATWHKQKGGNSVVLLLNDLPDQY
jgi:UDP-N-acetylmuramoyl-tripeptide--D-alanyl-D-alanine ligase